MRTSNAKVRSFTDTEITFGEISTLMSDMQDSIDAVYEEIQKVATHEVDVAETIQTMAATSQETAAACEEVSAWTDGTAPRDSICNRCGGNIWRGVK